MQDRKMEEQIWDQARRWKMQDRKMEEQIWGQARRWKMRDRKMEDQKMEAPVSTLHGTLLLKYELARDLTCDRKQLL